MPASRKLQGDDALKLLEGKSHFYAAKGKQVVHFDLKKDKPARAQLLEHLLGPTGNLRAPAWVKGQTVVVGFNPDLYQELLG